jgi:hypothetical protein
MTFHKFLQYLDRFQQSTNVISSPDYRTDQAVTLSFKSIEATQKKYLHMDQGTSTEPTIITKFTQLPWSPARDFRDKIYWPLNDKFHSSCADNE